MWVGIVRSVEGLNEIKRPTSLSKQKFLRPPSNFICIINAPEPLICWPLDWNLGYWGFQKAWQPLSLHSEKSRFPNCVSSDTHWVSRGGPLTFPGVIKCRVRWRHHLPSQRWRLLDKSYEVLWRWEELHTHAVLLLYLTLDHILPKRSPPWLVRPLSFSGWFLW